MIRRWFVGLLLCEHASAGAWRRVYSADQYPILVLKLSLSSDDPAYTVEEVRTFRAIPDFVAQFVQEFRCAVSLAEPRQEHEPLCGTA